MNCLLETNGKDGIIGETKMSNSYDKMDVIVKVMPDWDNKKWVVVTLKKSKRFIPSFEDVYRIVKAICYCEDLKYPNGKGARMVSEFLVDVCNGLDFEELKEKYQIPNRSNQ